MIENGTFRKQKDFSLTNITGDSRLIALPPEKIKEFYILSDFYKEFTNFKLMEQDLFRFDGFKQTKYRFSDREISDTFKIHLLHSNALDTRNVFDLMPVFKSAKSESIGQKFKDHFFCYLLENNIEVFTTEKKIMKEKLEILYTLLTRQDNLNF